MVNGWDRGKSLSESRERQDRGKNIEIPKRGGEYKVKASEGRESFDGKRNREDEKELG